MPLGLQEGSLLVAGSVLLASSAFFYRAKQTLPFKVAYFLTWPVLGSGVILAVQPASNPNEEKPDLDMLQVLPADLKTSETAQHTVRLLNEKLAKKEV